MKIENFFAALKNGDWRNIPELADQIKIPVYKLTEFSQVVSKEEGIIEYREREQQIKIDPKWQNLLPDEIETKSVSQSFRRKNPSQFNVVKSVTSAKQKRKLQTDSTSKSRSDIGNFTFHRKRQVPGSS